MLSSLTTINPSAGVCAHSVGLIDTGTVVKVSGASTWYSEPLAEIDGENALKEPWPGVVSLIGLINLEPPPTGHSNGPRPESRRVEQAVRGNVVPDLKCRLRIKRVVDEERKLEVRPNSHRPEIE